MWWWCIRSMCSSGVLGACVVVKVLGARVVVRVVGACVAVWY